MLPPARRRPRHPQPRDSARTAPDPLALFGLVFSRSASFRCDIDQSIANTASPRFAPSRHCISKFDSLSIP
ncbi:hypothetical protein VTO73DRAFT_14235 [Trametes versicolor]